MAKVSNKDWVRLSAYLDGELSRNDSEQIDKRIKTDPEFQAALDALRTTKQVLNATPRLKVPRRFTLKPEMVGMRAKSKPARGYSLAAVALTFLFIGVVVIDFGRSFSGVAFAPAAPREIMLEALPEAALEAIEEPALMAEEAELEAADSAAGDSQADDMMEATVPAPALAAEAVEEAEEGLPEESEAKSADEIGADTAANQADADQPEIPEEETASEPQSSQTPEPQPSQTLEPQPTPEPVIEATGEIFYDWEKEVFAPRVDMIRILEWVFGLGALVLGILAWIKRRNM